MQRALDVPTICQRLFFHGAELADGAAAAAALGIVAHDTLELREAREGERDDDVAGDGERRDEGRAFGGTVLGGAGAGAGAGDRRACAVCTFINADDAAARRCLMCGSPL